MRRMILIAGFAVLAAAGAQAATPAKKPAAAAVKPAATAVKPAAQPEPAPLPVFTFKGATAGAPMDPTTVGKCEPDDNELKCRGSDPMVAGIELPIAPSYYFYEGRLTSMLFLFDARGTDYLTLLQAFTEKYGKPCKQEVEKWQSQGGATYDNATATWCFRTGKLKLEALGPSLKYGTVTYNDDFSAPAKATPKDF